MLNRLVVLLVALWLLPSLAASAATIYRSVDAQGNVTYTDTPVAGGEAVELAPLTVVPAQRLDRSRVQRPRAASPSAAAPRRAVSGDPFLPYSTFRIASPNDAETLPTGSAGNVQVQLAIAPALREDHRVQLLVDGRVSQSPMHTTAFMLLNLVRGEHVLQAELLDAGGQVRHRSPPVTLYVQRASINLPQNPNNPANRPNSARPGQSSGY